MRKLKQYIGTMILVISVITTKAQIESPVKWAFGAKKLSNKEAVIFFKATIQDGWHIYDQNMADGGPVRTAFTYVPSADYSLIGETMEPKPIKKYEDVFSMDVDYYEHSVVFQQKIKLNSSHAIIKGKLVYMACTDQKCLPEDDIDFSIPIK